jgi:hypothetical protein
LAGGGVSRLRLRPKFANTPVVDKTIAEIVPHIREDQAFARLDVGTMPASAP